LLENKDREEEIRGKERRKESVEQLVVRKGQEGRNQGNSWWQEKDRKEETRGTVYGKKSTRRKKPGEQWWKEKDRKE
jgi:hypothetical protein